MNAKKRLHALTDTDIPVALTYPTPSPDITITPLHFFKSDIENHQDVLASYQAEANRIDRALFTGDAGVGCRLTRFCF